MAELSIKAPVSTLVSPKTWYKSRDALKEQLKKTWELYKKDIKDVSELTKVPPSVLLAFMQIESGGKFDAGQSNGSMTTGLMQWNRLYAGGSNYGNTLQREYTQGRLSEAEKDEFKKVGITFDKKGNTRALTLKDQLNPRLNILIGAITLGQFIDEDWGTEGDNVRLDRVIARYNIGPNALKGFGVHNKTLAQVHSSVPSNPTRGYIEKMLGKDGVLDIISTDLKDIVK